MDRPEMKNSISGFCPDGRRESLVSDCRWEVALAEEGVSGAEGEEAKARAHGQETGGGLFNPLGEVQDWGEEEHAQAREDQERGFAAKEQLGHENAREQKDAGGGWNGRGEFDSCLLEIDCVGAPGKDRQNEGKSSALFAVLPGETVEEVKDNGGLEAGVKSDAGAFERPCHQEQQAEAAQKARFGCAMMDGEHESREGEQRKVEMSFADARHETFEGRIWQSDQSHGG